MSLSLIVDLNNNQKPIIGAFDDNDEAVNIADKYNEGEVIVVEVDTYFNKNKQSPKTETVKIEIEKEIENLQNELVSEDELNTAKNYLLGSLLRNFDGAFNISERYKSFLELESTSDFYDRYIAAVNTVTSEDLRLCANNYFQFNSFKYCVAGEVQLLHIVFSFTNKRFDILWN